MIFQLSLILHALVILLALSCFIIGIALWKKIKQTSQYWKFFTIGLFFIWLSELADIFSPIYKQQFGGINFYTEATQGVGVALLLLGVIGFVRRKVAALEQKNKPSSL